jgi:Trypsin
VLSGQESLLSRFYGLYSRNVGEVEFSEVHQDGALRRRAAGMRRRVVLVLATMALAVLVVGGVAQAIKEPAIINGEPDRGPDAHPYVGALVTVPASGEFKGQRIPVCSGTLISPKVFLTAGHCTDFLIREDLPTYVSFDPTYKPGASKVMKATPHTHPKFCIPDPEDKVDCAPQVPTEALIAREWRYDVGVAFLDRPVRMTTYGALPDAGLVDTLKEGKRLTVVGYGANRFDLVSKPPLQPVFVGDRYRATVRLLDTKTPAVGDMFLKTTGVSLTGGNGETSCYGDSGGPLFVPDQQTIVGVTSFGIAPLCRGPGYNQRMDLPRVLSWVRSFP